MFNGWKTLGPSVSFILLMVFRIEVLTYEGLFFPRRTRSRRLKEEWVSFIGKGSQSPSKDIPYELRGGDPVEE